MGLIIYFLFCGILLTFAILRFFGRAGLPSRSVLLPYQSGVLYQGGRPMLAVGPGSHWVILVWQKILFLDTRPIQVNVEERAVSLADGATAFYGVAASAKVSDARKAIYAAANYNEVPVFVTLSASRSILSQSTSSELTAERAKVEQQIVDACRLRLASSGFELLSFRLTWLSIGGPGLWDDEDA